MIAELVDRVDQISEYVLEDPAAEPVLGAHDVPVGVRGGHREDLMLEVDPEFVDLVDQHTRGADRDAGSSGRERAGRDRDGCGVVRARVHRRRFIEAELARDGGQERTDRAVDRHERRQAGGVDARELHQLVVVGGRVERAVVAQLEHVRAVPARGDAPGETRGHVVHGLEVRRSVLVHLRPVFLHIQNVRERQAAADRRNAVTLDEREECALVAFHDLEGVIGSPPVLPHQHGYERLGRGVDRDDRGVLAADPDGVHAASLVRVRRGHLANGVDERCPHRVGVLLCDLPGSVHRQRPMRGPGRGSVAPHQRDLHVRRADVDPQCVLHLHPRNNARARISARTMVRLSNRSVPWHVWSNVPPTFPEPRGP